MANNWDDFVLSYAKEQYENALFDLNFIGEMFKSPIERVMFVVLRDELVRGFSSNLTHLEPQKKIGKYTVDFYLSYMSDTGLVEFIIECDGHDYHERTKAQAAHDKKRDRYFTANGYIVLRYTGSEIFRDHKNLTKPIWEIIVKKDLVI